MLLLQALLTISAAVASAHADTQTMANYTGTYAVKDCQYSENYVSNPKDYNCRFTEIRLVAKDAKTFEISYTDELGQKLADVTMTEFRQDEKDGTILQATFSNTDYNSAWTLTRQGNPDGSSYTDNRTFSIDTQSGVVTYDHQISVSSPAAYKSADWIYKLKKQ